MSLQLEHCEQSTYCFDILGLVVNDVGRGAKVQGLTGVGGEDVWLSGVGEESRREEEPLEI